MSFCLPKNPQESLIHSIPRTLFHAKAPALWGSYLGSSSFYLQGLDWWYLHQIWYNIGQRFILIHLFSQQKDQNFQLQKSSLLHLKPDPKEIYINFTYHYLMNYLGIITNQSQPCVLLDIGEIWRYRSASSELRKSTALGLIPYFL